MNSSTSSSNISSSETRPRVVFARIFLLVIVGMGAAMGLVRLFAAANDAGSETLMERVQEARAALPQILAEEDPLVMAFGSSMTEAGFHARRFDARMAERGLRVKSFNFGFGGLNPFFQDYLARRIREAFEEEDRRLELAVIEFVPFQATTARWQGAQPVIDSFLTLLASPEEIWRIARENPTRGVRIANIRYLRDSVSAEMVTHFFSRPLRPSRTRSEIPEDEAVVARRRELGGLLMERVREDFPDYEGQDWWYPWQGAGPLPEERAPETLEIFREYYETARTEHRLDDDRLDRIHCCDIQELHFEEELVASFVRVVKVFQQFSDHVEVVLYPRNTAWIEYGPEARARLDGVLERIRKETGVTIRNHQLLESITPEMYSDTTHLANYSGNLAYTDHLAEEYGPILEEALAE